MNLSETIAEAPWQELLDFWFSEAAEPKWFEKDLAFDAELKRRFGNLHREAGLGRLDSWRLHPDGALALILVLDQLSRNFYRGAAAAYALDEQARLLASYAVNRCFDLRHGEKARMFIYLPFEHSERLDDQRLCVHLMGQLPSLTEQMRYVERHREIIERFGRFPHRNQILGRLSTEAEEAFLLEPMSSF